MYASSDRFIIHKHKKHYTCGSENISGQNPYATTKVLGEYFRSSFSDGKGPSTRVMSNQLFTELGVLCLDLDKIPCPHVMAALRPQYVHKYGTEVYEHSSQYYSVEKYEMTYSGHIAPVPPEESWVVPVEIMGRLIPPPYINPELSNRKEIHIRGGVEWENYFHQEETSAPYISALATKELHARIVIHHDHCNCRNLYSCLLSVCGGGIFFYGGGHRRHHRTIIELVVAIGGIGYWYLWLLSAVSVFVVFVALVGVFVVVVAVGVSLLVVFVMKIKKDENMDELFKKSCFGHFLKLGEDAPACFLMMMVYGLLKRRIKFLKDLMDKTIPKQYREQLRFVWLAYSVILAKDINKAWAFEAILPLQKQVVHPQIVPTEGESLMTSYITLGHVNTIADATIELIRKELDGATTIRREVRQGQPNVETLHDQPTKVDSGAFSGVVVDVGGRHVDADTTRDDEYVDAH
ncbi:hypothetical protein FXO37_12464 [Capsicum annuum]|nr:hypothetical protein FXO37_12464 [Capsicum annuum]